MEVILTTYDFLYNRLSMPKYFTSQWLRVDEFKKALDHLSEQGSRIDDESVIKIMEPILNQIGDAETINGISVNTLKRGFDLLVRAHNVNQMDGSWFIKKFGEIYKQVISLRRNEDFVVNPIQMDRFLDLINFFLHHIDEDDKVEIEETEPRQGFGGVTATFLVMTLRGDEVREFSKVVKYCSAVSIDSCDDGACISCTVPDIFVRNEN